MLFFCLIIIISCLYLVELFDIFGDCLSFSEIVVEAVAM